MINTEESVIESLENGDYEGDSFLRLNIIATALQMRASYSLIK